MHRQARPTPVEPEARQCPDCGEPIDSVAHWHEDKAATRRLAVEPDGLPLDVERAVRAIESMSAPGADSGNRLIPSERWISVGVVRSILEGRHPILASTPSEAKPPSDMDEANRDMAADLWNSDR